MFARGVDAVLGDRLLLNSLSADATHLWVGDLAIPRDSFDRLVVIGAGKASAAMAAGLSQFIQSQLPTLTGQPMPVIGHVNVPEGCFRDLPGITIQEARPAGVNEPTEAAIQGTDRILELVSNAGPRDLVIGLISGGGSALLCRPSPGISLTDKLTVTRWLSSHGADIVALNTVRKHLSDVKGGGLLRANRHAQLLTLVLSDVLGDPLDLIASGPTVPDRSTPQDALSVLQRFDPEQQLPSSIWNRLRHAADHPIATTADEDHHQTIVLGNNAVAVDAAGIEAEARGYNHVMHCHRESEGDAEVAGRHLADLTHAMLMAAPNVHRQDALLSGGEPTVSLADASIRGVGGRNGQLVLAAYARLLEIGLTDDQWSRLAILSGGTDGEDGPSEAAGGMVNGEIHRRIQEQNLDVHDTLRRNDSHGFLRRVGGLLLTGPTGTNVCDLRIALVDHPQHRRHTPSAS
ncbi:glycerate kinase type-2 family protein [Rhodopirellula halodulae]|uniref:glycerate kinase type-2 family protein n=1 Tax=Rhodopirellula halodulae TaxID=2894198 RepID=UPI001E415E36|nr:DUF4147 domain-containing protein [Rhodopirellula sp. JC737]MCC9654359.1 DUF4147 domain-containing protein [Rhodopirellula sp. JC737]